MVVILGKMETFTVKNIEIITQYSNIDKNNNYLISDTQVIIDRNNTIYANINDNNNNNNL